MQEITELISTVGFPIAVAIGLFWYILTEQKELRKVIESNTEALLKILEHFREKGGN